MFDWIKKIFKKTEKPNDECWQCGDKSNYSLIWGWACQTCADLELMRN